MKGGVYDVAFRKIKIVKSWSQKVKSQDQSEIGVDWTHLLAKLPNLSRCYDFAHSQAMRTEVSFQNYNEKEKKKIFGSISPQNLLFEQVIAIKSGSNTSLNTQVLSWFQ